jgi:hypothetical protein
MRRLTRFVRFVFFVRLVPFVCFVSFVSFVPLEAQRSHGKLFPPQDLGLLEAPDRVQWQRPDQIMDALGVADASIVADLGAGSGWFTIRLARRVGPRSAAAAIRGCPLPPSTSCSSSTRTTKSTIA